MGAFFFSAPTQALFHTARFCPAPGFFFLLFFGLWGHACLGELDATDATLRLELVFRERNIEFLELSVYTPEKPRSVSPETPAAVWIFYMMEGEILAVFFADFSLETVPLHFEVFQSSVCLRFFRRFFGNELWNGESGVFGDVFLVTKMPGNAVRFCIVLLL